jgi:hypothetical protein
MMLMLGTRTLLGLAVDEDGIVIAELRIHSGRPEIERVGQWSFTEKLSSDNATELGQEFKHFLRSSHFSSKNAVVGIPTKWVIAKQITAPPASSDALAGMLSIQAERTFSLNASELVFDYCGRTSTAEQCEVLLVAARRQIIAQIQEMMLAAGLRIQALTVSALAFSKALSEVSSEHGYGLYARGTYCEFWTQANGSPRSIQHVPLPAKNGAEHDYSETLTSTIQRLISFSSEQDHRPPHRITAYDGCGLSHKLVDRLNEQLKPQITVADGITGLLPGRLGRPNNQEQIQSVAALAVAITAARADRPLIDFLNPRIGVHEKVSHKRITVWASIIGGFCLLALMVALLSWRANTRDIATYSGELELMSEDIAAAREVVDRITHASSWTSQEPVFLNCLRELTLIFPEEPTIWATNLRLSGNAGALVGKAVNEASFYEVLDKLKQNGAFSDVQMIHIRNAGRDSLEKEFAVNFEFRGKK